MRFPVQVALILLSATMLPLCFPPFGWWPLVFLVFPLLLLATTNTTPRRAFYLGMLHGVIGYGITLSWLFRIFATAAISLFAIMAVFTAIFCLLFNFFTKHTKSAFLKVLMAATLWTAIEFYRSELFFLRFPWITPGATFGPTFLSPILGVYGSSFLVIAASASFMQRRTLPLALLLFLCAMCLGLFHPGQIAEPVGENSLVVTVVQSEDCVLESYFQLTRSELKESPDLIIWPEYSLPYDVRHKVADMATLTNLCAEMNAILIVGTKTIVGPEDKNWYNTALLLDKSGVIGEYHKARPVHFFNDGIPGHEFSPTRTGLGNIATPICFDCDYTEVTRQMVKLGAEFFAVPSFDAESWSANQHLQHALLFRLRAAENARWLACAASSGISQVIDPHGNVHKSLSPMKDGALTCRIGRSNSMTFFVRFGWLFTWLTIGVAAILLAYGAFRFITGRDNEKRQTGPKTSELFPFFGTS
jgi:apolipoprotein N-acyltransferase